MSATNPANGITDTDQLPASDEQSVTQALNAPETTSSAHTDVTITARSTEDFPQASPNVTSPTTGNVSLPEWGLAADAWRLARRIDIRHVNLVFRLLSAGVVPHALRSRFLSMGLPADLIDATLRSIRSASQWSEQWIESAQRYLGEYRRQTATGDIRDAALSRQIAGLCYHAAQIFELEDERIVATCRAAAASLFTLSLPQLHPNTRHVRIPWRSQSLPAYFETPEDVSTPVGIVVLLNGVSMAKEETIAWSRRFTDAGYAVLALDTPGTGEATTMGLPDGNENDVLDGVFDFFRREKSVDLRRVAVLGCSLGANQAVKCAAYDRRIMTAIAVTPPYDPARWIRRASPLLQQELGLIRDGDEADVRWGLVDQFDISASAVQMRQPLLVFGGGQDMIVPPNESQLLANRAGDKATLVWVPDGGHCLYEMVDSWCFDALAWITSIAAARADGETSAAALNVIGRAALENASYAPLGQDVLRDLDEDYTEYARLISVDNEGDNVGRESGT